FPVLLNEIGAAVCAFLRYCSGQATSSKQETKRVASKRMRIILGSLVPDNRERKKQVSIPQKCKVTTMRNFSASSRSNTPWQPPLATKRKNSKPSARILKCQPRILENSSKSTITTKLKD